MTKMLLAVFATPDDATAAARAAFERGFPASDMLSPHPLADITPYLMRDSGSRPIGWIMFAAGICGGAIGYATQWYSAVIDYPVLEGGRGLHSWPAFLLVPYETTILAAAVVGSLALLWLCDLPKLFHSLFAASATERAVQDRYVLVFEARSGFRDQIVAILHPASVEEIES